jgi:GAF domain-containing protein
MSPRSEARDAARGSAGDTTQDRAPDRAQAPIQDSARDSARNSAREDVQDLLLQDENIVSFLHELAVLGGKLFGEDASVVCGLMSRRLRRQSTVASSSSVAADLNEAQYQLQGGPALHAMTTGTLVVVDDGQSDSRWQDYFHLTARFGFASVLAAPLPLGAEGHAALMFYAQARAFFTPERQHAANVFVEQAGKALEMAMRVARYREAAEDRRLAMETRTSIDIAIGIIIAQNRCTQEEAFALLRRASNTRNTKLRDVAEALIVQATGMHSTTHFTN